MANIGKHIDRSPCLRSAGIRTPIKETVSDVFKIYDLEEEAAEEILRAKCKNYQEKLKRQNLMPRYPFLPENSIQDLLSTELKKSRFVAFREKFSEDMFFKKPELGKVSQVNQTKPDNITNENTTFGRENKRSESVYELMFPHKSPEQVNLEYIEFHEKYLLSHEHYLPGEKKNRKYVTPYDPFQTFGIVYPQDFSGAKVKNCMTQCDDNVIVISKAQKYFLEKNLGRVGTKITKYLNDFPEDMTFGRKNIAEKCDAKALVENIPICLSKSKLVEAISHINKLRHSLFERVNYNPNDLRASLSKEDKQKTGFLSLSKIFEIARMQYIRFNEDKVRTALKHFNLINEEGSLGEKVNYIEFCKLLTIGHPLPKTGNISTMPNENYNKFTTYRKLCEDLGREPAKDIYTKMDIDNTTVKDVISPNVPVLLGLTQRDFDEPRDQCALKRIFKYLPAHAFDIAWNQAIANAKSSNMISVNMLRDTLKVISKEKEII